MFSSLLQTVKHIHSVYSEKTPRWLQRSVIVVVASGCLFYGAKRALTLPRGPCRMSWTGIVVGHRGARFIGSAMVENAIEHLVEAQYHHLRSEEDHHQNDDRHHQHPATSHVDDPVVIVPVGKKNKEKQQQQSDGSGGGSGGHNQDPTRASVGEDSSPFIFHHQRPPKHKKKPSASSGHQRTMSTDSTTSVTSAASATSAKSIPENTIESFVYALEHGADGIEFDVRMISSGEFMVFHDGYAKPEHFSPKQQQQQQHEEPHQQQQQQQHEELDPSQTVPQSDALAVLESVFGSGAIGEDENPPSSPSSVAAATAASKKSLLRVTTFDSLNLFEIAELRYAGAPASFIPTLDQVIELCRERNVRRIFIELKTYTLRWSRLDEMARRYCDFYNKYRDYLEDHAVTISFHPLLLYLIRRRDPTIPVCLLHERSMMNELGDDALSKEEAKHYLQYVPGFVLSMFDELLHFANREVFIDMIGCSMYGPEYEYVDEGFLRTCFAKGVCVYLWGAKTPDDIDDVLKRSGTCMSCDDNYGEFKSHFLTKRN